MAISLMHGKEPLNVEENIPIKGQIYRHYSGKDYEILALALDHNLEKVVVYRALYEDPKLGKDVVWVRKLSEWNEPAIINGTSQTRYKIIQ